MSTGPKRDMTRAKAAAGKALSVALLAVSAAAAGEMAPIPSSSREVIDGFTGSKLTIAVGEFLLSSTEITQREFEEVMGYNPSHYRGEARPVESVSWWEAIAYANRRSTREGLPACYDLATGRRDGDCLGYRLPTDAEWSAAAGEAEPKNARLGLADTKDSRAMLRLARDQGTFAVGTLPGNRFGLHDMWGNVWEWCDDWADPVSSPAPAGNPSGPTQGLARVLRGGSFLSTTGSWARGYRTSVEPGRKSPYTGFRIARGGAAGPTPSEEDWFEPYNRAPAGYENSIGSLTPLTGPEPWPARRKALLEKWRAILGAPSIPPPAPEAELAAEFDEPNYAGRLMFLRTEPDSREKILLMLPKRSARGPLPVLIVPYYDVDVPAGKNLGGRSYVPPSVRSFAYMAAQQGWIAVAIRWFGESYGERYEEAVANLALRHPDTTGLGKWVWDAQRLVDYLHTLPFVDRSRIAIMGHSLGAKMSLYAAAMDERIGAVVFCEGGIGLKFSNYEDYWYLGERAETLPPGADHHELLALIAPRPFLLIAGESADKDESWRYINAARAVYAGYGKPRNIGLFNHRTGHSPTPESTWRAIEWLKRFLQSSNGG
ncbi:MAG: SUMF1/EgtB/PvdO family nonheme iron enzyme [Bryobacteraceae bacterium]|nr:SUMF1/EgtB/PvdO family nonheme iron enzyme [Bryobacteraceae bacterium]